MRKATVVLGALAVIAATWWVFFRGGDQSAVGLAQSTLSGDRSSTSDIVTERSSDQIVGRAGPQREAARVTVPTSSRAYSGRASPLPPLNTPLKLVYRDLKELAAKGDAHAACRLAVELSRCATAKELARKASEIETEAQQFDPSSPRGQLAAQMAPRLRTISDQTNEVCQEFTPDPGDQAWRYQLQAAQAGDVPSMLGFVSGIHSGLDPKNPLATPEAWDAYREYAPQLIGQAVETGNPGAYQLAASLSRFPLFGMRVLPEDPVRAAAYYMALQSAATPEYAQVMGKAIAGLNLSPDDLARASALSIPLSAKLQSVDGPIDLSSNFITGSKDPDAKPGSECSR